METKDYNQKWVENNIEKCRESKRQYKLRNREKIAAYNKLYNNSERGKSNKKEWIVDNRDKVRKAKSEYKQRNPDVVQASNHTRRGYGRLPTKLLKAVIEEEPNCRLCGAPSEETDHIVPLIDGGTHERTNLQRLCKQCHTDKTRIENTKRYRTCQS